MKGSYQLADLHITVEGNTTQLVRAQQTEREFERACETLREVSGADDVLIRSDHVEPKNGGPEFDQIRLRAYRPDESKHYTIDVGTTDNNPFGMYPRVDDGIKVWDWDAQEQHIFDPETGEITEGRDSGSSQSAPNPSGDAEASASRQQHESEKVYDTSGQSQPTPNPAANQLLEKVGGHPDDTLVRDVEIEGTSLTKKLVGLAEYLDHGNGYLSRVRDAAGVTDLGDVAMGQIREVVFMIVDEQALEENEQLQPDDDLPF